MNTVKLFGFCLPVPANQNDHQDTITTNDDASRKRKVSPNQEDDDSFIPKKPKMCDDGEEAVPPSEFHPLSVSTDDAIYGKRKSSLNQEEDDDSFNDGEEYDDDSFIPKKSEVLKLIDDLKLETESPNPGEANEEEEAVPPRMLAEGSSILEEDYDLSLSTKPGIFMLFGVYISTDQEGHTIIQNPNQDDQMEEEENENEVEDQAPIQNPNQEEEDENEVEDEAPIQNPNQEEEDENEVGGEAPIQNPNQEEVEEEAPDPPEGNLVFMFEKELTSSDVARNHNRLLITKRASLQLMAALTEEERGRVEVNNLRVVTTDPNGVEYTLKLKRWAGSGALVLKHEWGKLVRANRLQIGDSVEARGYRLHDQFHLFLFKI